MKHYVEILPARGPFRRLAVAAAGVLWRLTAWLDRAAYRTYWLGDRVGRDRVEAELRAVLLTAPRTDGEFLQ